MRITVRFADGTVEEFDTGALTTDSALGRANALTDLRVTLGDGLWLEASWYRVPQADDDAGKAPLAREDARMPPARALVPPAGCQGPAEGRRRQAAAAAPAHGSGATVRTTSREAGAVDGTGDVRGRR